MTLQWKHHVVNDVTEDKTSVETSSVRQRTSTSSPLDIYEDDSGRPSNHSNSSSGTGNTQYNFAGGKGPLRAVHFSDTKGLELTQAVQGDTYYPTPQMARSIVHNGSLRRFTADEVELYFSEDVHRYPVTPNDYAVRKLQQRCDILIAGSMELMKKKTLVLSKWRKCRAELHHGVLILRPIKEGGSSGKKRTIIPIASCKVDFAALAEHQLEITFTYQLETAKRRVRLESMTDMFMWWWGIQLASKCRCDMEQLHQAIQSKGKADKRDAKGLSERPYSTSALHHLGNPHQAYANADTRTLNGSSSDVCTFFPRTMARKETVQVQGTNGASEIISTISAGIPMMSDGPAMIHSKATMTTGVTHLLLIRHAEAENIQFRVSDRDKYLTERGQRQAEKTAQYLEKQLREVMASDDNVELIYGGLLRSVETAQVFHKHIPWLRHSYHCCFLEDGAPKEIGPLYRQEYRNAMHKMAFEFICHWDAHEDKSRSVPITDLEKYKIVICHTSFIQYCLAQCYQISKDIIQLGAPIAHCSISQIDIKKGESMTATYSNRVTHLPLTHRTTD
ncbi:hypothetical protein ABG067_001810 [Albugo candida]